MSIIFFISFLLFFSSSVSSTHDDDEHTLLKIKKQLGNPDLLKMWVKGYNFCAHHSSNVFADPVFIGCSSTGRVTTLFLINFNVTAPFPDAICDLTELDALVILTFPGLYGPIPSCITELTNIRNIMIQGTSLSGRVPSFNNQAKLTVISLENSHLSGTIPASLSTLPNLDWLHLSSNNLTGTIPAELFRTPNPSLHLSNNMLTGKIPDSYKSVDFSSFMVSNNRLSGDASFLFGRQKVAREIMLANNDFEFDLGTTEISSNLFQLDISNNKIYGKVPDSFVKPESSFMRNLSNNRLCGELPKDNGFTPEEVANNLCLCGYPLQPCSG